MPEAVVASEAPVTTEAPATAAPDPKEAAKAAEAAKDAAAIAAMRTKLGLDKKASAAPAPKAAESAPGSDGSAKDVNGAKESPPPSDADYAANLAHLAKLDREVKARAAKLEAKAKELEAIEALSKKAGAHQERFKAGERAAAIREHIRDTFGEDPTVDDVATLMELLGSTPAALTEADIEKKFQALRAKERAEEEAAAKKRDEELKASITNGEQALVGHAKEYFTANIEKYPAIAYRGVRAERIVELLREGHRATGQLPSHADIFDYLENQFREEAKSSLSFLAPEKPAPEPAKPMRTFGAKDKQGATPAPPEEKKPEKRETLAEKRARFLASFKQSAAQ